MKLFSGSANKPLASKIAKVQGISVSPIETHIFPDGERRIKLEEDVVGQDVVIVNPTSPPVDNNLMELCFILDAVTRSGAKSTTAVVPYLGYQRQDHIFRVGEARSLEVVVNMIEGAGATRFIGVDFHSIKIPELFSIPVTHLSAIPLFAEKIKEFSSDFTDVCIVTPDMGGIRRIDLLKEELGGNIETVAVEKDRDIVTGGIKASGVHGTVKKTCFIVDDMISSGKTIVQCIEELQKLGAEKFFVMATHAVFSSDAPRLLEGSSAELVFVTDSIEVPEDKKFKKLEIMSLAPLIAEALSA